MANGPARSAACVVRHLRPHVGGHEKAAEERTSREAEPSGGGAGTRPGRLALEASLSHTGSAKFGQQWIPTECQPGLGCVAEEEPWPKLRSIQRCHPCFWQTQLDHGPVHFRFHACELGDAGSDQLQLCNECGQVASGVATFWGAPKVEVAARSDRVQLFGHCPESTATVAFGLILLTGGRGVLASNSKLDTLSSNSSSMLVTMFNHVQTQ